MESSIHGQPHLPDLYLSKASTSLWCGSSSYRKQLALHTSGGPSAQSAHVSHLSIVPSHLTPSCEMSPRFILSSMPTQPPSAKASHDADALQWPAHSSSDST